MSMAESLNFPLPSIGLPGIRMSSGMGISLLIFTPIIRNPVLKLLLYVGVENVFAP